MDFARALNVETRADMFREIKRIFACSVLEISDKEDAAAARYYVLLKVRPGQCIECRKFHSPAEVAVRFRDSFTHPLGVDVEVLALHWSMAVEAAMLLGADESALLALGNGVRLKMG